MRAISPTLAGFVALAAVSIQVAPDPSIENWRPPRPAFSFSLGDQGCGAGWHQALLRDWRNDWWWGPCVPNKRPAPSGRRLDGIDARSRARLSYFLGLRGGAAGTFCWDGTPKRRGG